MTWIMQCRGLSVRRAREVAFLAALCFMTGCGSDITTFYGERDSGGAAGSVNGTGVLAGMFEKEGFRVSSWGSLSPRLRTRADCIVWFPNDFSPPNEKVCKWLTEWLSEGEGRTLIYVGRDYDAAPLYWQTVQTDAPEDQKKLLQKRLQESQDHFTTDRPRDVKGLKCDWFQVVRKPARKIRSLQGSPDWIKEVDPSRLAIELNDRLVPPKSSEVLLQSDGDVLVSRDKVGNGQLILVANGSFLLNVALVNHDHRKLAGSLIRMVPESDNSVVFLESFIGGPRILDKDPKPPSGWELFGIWPTNWVLLQFTIVGLIFCISRWPIFGRPRTELPHDESDFGRHIDALANLLQHTGDEEYAEGQILGYRQSVEKEKNL